MKNIELSIKEMIESIKDYQYVSFDVFDTLIFRTVSSPDKIFDLAILEYQDKYGDYIETFKIKRQYAEHLSRKYYSREVSIDEIYEFLEFNDEVTNRFKQIEKSIEVKNCVPNPPMISVLNECKKRGQKIVITSDMYLTSDVFKDIFLKIGIAYDYLFISGEIRKTKWQGTIFPYLLNQLNIDCSQIVHVGDNTHSDILMPRKYDIHSLVGLQKETIKCESYCLKSSVVSDQLVQLYRNAILGLGEVTPEFRVGYNVIGPFLFSFCKWIHSKKEENKIDILFFVAREGFLIKKIYDILYPKDKTKYVRLNKNLLRLPSLDNGDVVENYILSLPPRKSYKLDDLCTTLGVENKDGIITFLKNNGFEVDNGLSIKCEDLHGDKYELIAAMVEYQKTYIVEQKKCLFDYLASMEAIGKKVGLVNNSMQGSGQYLLENICLANKFDIDIVGLQFASTKVCKNRLGDRFFAFFDDVKYYSIYNYIFCNFCLLIEHLLFEPNGTAIRFTMEDGGVQVICDESGSEKNDFPIIEKVQLASVKFAKQAKDLLNVDISESSVSAIINLFLSPIKEDACFIGNLWDKDVDRVRKINQPTSNYSLIELLLKHKPNSLDWVEGYVSEKETLRNWMKIFRIKKIILNYNKHKSLVLEDLLHLIDNRINYVLNYFSIVVIKIKYVLLLHLFNVKPKRR